MLFTKQKGFAILSWVATVGSKSYTWEVAATMLEVAASVWYFTAAMGNVTCAVWDVTDSMGASQEL